MGQIKEINIKSCTYYLFNDMVNIKNFDPNCVEIDKTSYKNIDICYIGCITIKDHVNIHSVLLIKQMISLQETLTGRKHC